MSGSRSLRLLKPDPPGRFAAMSALLLFGDTERSAALRHEIPLAIIDPLLFAEVGGRRVVLTSMLERDA